MRLSRIEVDMNERKSALRFIVLLTASKYESKTTKELCALFQPLISIFTTNYAICNHLPCLHGGDLGEI